MPITVKTFRSLLSKCFVQKPQSDVAVCAEERSQAANEGTLLGAEFCSTDKATCESACIAVRRLKRPFYRLEELTEGCYRSLKGSFIWERIPRADESLAHRTLNMTEAHHLSLKDPGCWGIRYKWEASASGRCCQLLSAVTTAGLSCGCLFCLCNPYFYMERCLSTCEQGLSSVHVGSKGGKAIGT